MISPFIALGRAAWTIFSGCLLVSLLFPTVSRAESELIPLGSVWKYLDAGIYPPNDSGGRNWKQVDFLEPGWSSGPAQLGYGDASITTTIDYGTANNKHITSYFRHTFQVADISQINGLALELMRDDGAVVYLNGTEVFRSNMPSGTIGHSTLASSSPSDESFLHQASIPTSGLVNGSNVIAVEVHQRSANSSDLRLDLRLSSSIVPFGSIWSYLDGGIEPPDDSNDLNWKQVDFLDSSWSSGPAQLGYGDSPATTVGYGTDANNKHVTTYFRHAFTLANPLAIEGLVLDLVRDDGAIVYLNGHRGVPLQYAGWNRYELHLCLRGDLKCERIHPTQHLCLALALGRREERDRRRGPPGKSDQLRPAPRPAPAGGVPGDRPRPLPPARDDRLDDCPLEDEHPHQHRTPLRNL